MTILNLRRFAHTLHGTFGEITIEGKPDVRWYTMERPWLNNTVGISCIAPAPGAAAKYYALRRGTFSRGGGYPDLEFIEVPGRSAIEVHAANLAEELRGCIAPGKTLASFAGKWGIANSRAALQEILDAIDEDDIAIVISWGFGA